MATLSIRLPGEFTDPSMPILTRDPLLDGDNGGVQCLYDLASLYSWPSQGAPTTGQVVYDLTTKNRNATWNVDPSSIAPQWKAAVKGMRFDGCTRGAIDSGTGIRIPPAVMAAIWNGGSVRQAMLVAYLELPTNADYYQNAGIRAFSDVDEAYTTAGKSWMILGQTYPAVRRLASRRVYGVNLINAIEADVTGHVGLLCQVASWWNGTQLHLRLKSTAGTTTATPVAAAQPATVDFSGEHYDFGMVGAFPCTATDRNWGVCRVFIEDTQTSNRIITTVLDEDWTRFAASRGI